MQDGIIAGNANSRYLKTVTSALSLYPDYESFMAALIAGTFPIDLNGINTGGWTQQGTPLNKANLFSDLTASALGLSASNTPNDALAKLKELNDNIQNQINTAVMIGSFSTEKISGAVIKSINLGYKPRIVILYSNSSVDFNYIPTYYRTGEFSPSYGIKVLTQLYSSGNTRITENGFSLEYVATGSFSADSIYYIAFK